MIEVYFEGPISGVSRRDTVTITATVKGKVKDVLTLTDAKLVNTKKKS